MTGIFAYLASPLWLAFLVVGILASLQARYVMSDPLTSDLSCSACPPRTPHGRGVSSSS